MSGAGGTLYLLAHHDDEVFCAGRLWEDLEADREIRLLWATAGGLAPAGRRQAEGRAVARYLGLPTGNAVSLGWPDQGALDHLPAILAAARTLLEGLDAVCAPAYEGGHPDHDAMNLLAARLRDEAGRLTAEEFSLYRRGSGLMAVKAAWPGGRAAPLAPPALRLRRHLARFNASQAPALLVLGAFAAAQRTLATEPRRELPRHDYARPPFDVQPLYEWYTRRRFAEFKAAALAHA